MTATAHAIVAGAIAARFPDPVVSVPLAFTSHFIMDAIPHWDFGTNWRKRNKSITGLFAIADTLIGITVSYFIYGGKVAFIPLMAAIFASIIPDWLEAPWYIFFATPKKHEPGKSAGILEKFCYRVYKTENFFHTKTQFPFGALTQVAATLFFLAILH